MIEINRKAKKKKCFLKDFSIYLSTQKNLSAKTIKAYEYDIKFFLKFLAPYFKKGLSLIDIDEKIVKDFFYHLTSKRKYSDNSLNRKLASLKRYFKYLEIKGYISRSPVSDLVSAKLPERVPKTFNISQFEMILDAIEKKPEKSLNSIFIKKRDRAIMELFFATGIRVSELVNLSLSQINFADKTLRVTGKGNQERIISINEIALDALKEYIMVRGSDGKGLFINKKGGNMTVRGIQHLFEKYTKEIGLNYCITPHTMRSTFAILLLEGGEDLLSIQKLLGHSCLLSTEIYLKASQKKREDICEFAHPRMKKSLQKNDRKIALKPEGKIERCLLSRIKIPLRFLKYRPSRKKVDDTISFYKKYSRFVKPLIVKRNNLTLVDGYERYIAAKELVLVGINVVFID